jgi:RNA polymerase sigma factor (sigma-70 family)
MDTSDFLSVLDQARRGDEDAVRQLVARYEPQIRRVVRVRLTNEAFRREFDSLDICQSVMADFFLGVRSNRYSLETPEQLIGLLAAMARHKFLKRAKRHSTAKRDSRRRYIGDVAELELAAKDDTPSAIVARKELRDAILACLSPAERTVAQRRSEGWSWQELVEEFGGTPDQLRVRHGRALARVRRELGLDERATD